MCMVNKIASSTYVLHFARLAKDNFNYDDKIQRKKIFNEFQLPKFGRKIFLKKWYNDDNLSLVIYRNPLERLASIYNDYLLIRKEFKVCRYVLNYQ